MQLIPDGLNDPATHSHRELPSSRREVLSTDFDYAFDARFKSTSELLFLVPKGL